MSLSTETRGKRTKAAHIFERDPLDWFVEPIDVTRLLLQVERFIGPTWDPACGGGNVLRAFLDAGLTIYGTDIAYRSPPALAWMGEMDFLTGDELGMADRSVNIVTNPPFYRAKGSEAFIRRALTLAKGKVAVFADIKFLASGGRARGLWSEFPPTRIWQIADRPSCPPGEYLAAGNEAGGGTADWCWLVWSRTEPHTTTTFGWLYRRAA